MTEAPTTATVQAMTIDRPEGWHDKSMLVLGAEQPGASGVSPTLVIAREAVPEDLPEEPAARLEAFVDRQVTAMRDALAGYHQQWRRHAGEFGPAAELRIDWLSEGIPITQWVTFAHGGGDQVVIATATAGRADFTALEPTFREMLASFRMA